MAGGKWSNRKLTSLLSLWSFLVMAVTGLVLYVVPQGRIAYWANWTFAGLSKEQWGNIHVLAMFLFLVTIGLHIMFNWRALIGYFKKKSAGPSRRRGELWLSLVLTLLFIVSGILELKPLGYLLDLETRIKDSWVSGPGDEPPFGHAELLKLGVLCKKTDIPIDEAIQALNEAGLKGVDATRVVGEIAAENGIAPKDLFLIIEPLARPPEVAVPSAGEAYSEAFLEETFAGTGLGRKTLAEVAQVLKLDAAELEQRLRDKGLTFEPSQTLKQIATRNDLPMPLDVVKAMVLN